MKLLICVSLLLCIPCFSQKDSVPLSDQSCSYFGEDLPSGAALSGGSSEAEQIISSIISLIGLKPRFEIRAARIPNAAAVIHKNKRFVLYNPVFIEELNRSVGSKWASVSILAHEIGHHLNGHTLEEGGSRPDIELEADEFSGFILRKLGATLDESQAAMKVAASVKASHTHPARKQRLEAIERGWINGGAGPDPGTGRHVQKPVVTEVPGEQKVLAEKFIAADIRFYADPAGVYHLTIRNNLVKIVDNKLLIIGRLAESNKKGYPYMIYDQLYNYLYVTGKGAIYNGAGKEVGAMRKK
jgi:hypothetical protein